jgi:hypothetical protein
MKQLNLLNKIYLLLIIVLLVGIVIKVWNYKAWARYYYGTSISAPASYPVKIRTSDLLTSDENTYINSDGAAMRYAQWGDSPVSFGNSKRRLPLKLLLNYVSYRDKSIYMDTIDLPVQLIDSIFKNHPSTEEDQLTFSVGIANKGNIIVWLQAKNYEITLLKHKITPKEPKGSKNKLNMLKYLDLEFQIPDSVKREFDLGLDKDANYIDSASKYLPNQIR